MSLENEIQVFTERYSSVDPEDLRIPPQRFERYANPGPSPVFKLECIHALLHEHCREGDRVLELGSGEGTNLTLMAGAQRSRYRLYGAEITLQGCRVARQRLEVNGLGDRDVSLQVADGNRLPYRDGVFDVVVGINILHHLDMRASLEEVRRVLKPGGRGIFTEPVILSRALDRMRRLIPYHPEEPTEDEHPLRPEDFALIRSLFAEVEVDHFEMLSRVHSMVDSYRVNAALHRIDHRLKRLLPFLRRFYSGSTVQFRKAG